MVDHQEGQGAQGAPVLPLVARAQTTDHPAAQAPAVVPLAAAVHPSPSLAQPSGGEALFRTAREAPRPSPSLKDSRLLVARPAVGRAIRCTGIGE